MAAPRASIAVSVTRAGLTLATAFALTRVFAGRSWLFLMVLGALIPPVLLAWSQRRHWHALVRFGAVVVSGVWLAALAADPGTSVAAVPSRATLAELLHELGRAPHTLRAAIVPVAPVGSALVLAFVGVFVAAALTHWIATSLEAPVGAFAPSIALFIVIAAIGSGSWIVTTALYALVSLGYLLALAQYELATRRTWFHTNRPRNSRLAAGGVVVGTIAVATALVFAPSVPGASGNPMLDYKHRDGGGDANLLSAPPPILTIKDKLTLGPIEELFTVKAPQAAYWRVIALDWFTNGNAWGVNRATEQSASKLTTPVNMAPSTPLHQQFHIAVLDPHWLPAAYQPVGINLKAARVVPDSLTLLVDSKEPLADLIYDVDSQIPNPPLAVLEQAPFSSRRAMAQNLALPTDFSTPVRALAEQVTGQARSPYGRAVALQSFFRNGTFKYTLDTKLQDSPSAIEEFLFRTRAGFCEQFAASFAAMARAVGVPARVAVGYQPGTLKNDGLFHVTNRNAHAWPEVWIDGAGWIPFEPTPGFSEPTLGIGTGGPRKATPNTDPNSTSTSTSAPSSQPTISTLASNAPDSPFRVEPLPPAGAKHSAVGHVLIAAAIAFGAVALGAVALLGAASFTLWQRGRRRRHDHDPRRRVLGAWAEALDHLRAAGVPPRPSATSLEFALRFAPAHGAGDAGLALMELARLQSAAMYAREAPSPADAEFAWKNVDTIRDAIRHNVARTTRWRRRLRQPQ